MDISNSTGDNRKFYINFLTCCKMKYVKAKWTENEAPVSVID